MNGALAVSELSLSPSAVHIISITNKVIIFWLQKLLNTRFDLMMPSPWPSGPGLRQTPYPHCSHFVYCVNLNSAESQCGCLNICLFSFYHSECASIY